MNMKLLSEERFKRLAEKSGWTIERAQGFSEGQTARTRGLRPSVYAMVGADDYCMGYREGFYGRQTPVSTSSVQPEYQEKEPNSGPS